MRLFFWTILFLLLGAGNVHAGMAAVSENLAEIRSSPSLNASTVRLQVPRYYPLATQEAEGDFFKVTDYLGRTGWIQKTSINKIRTIVVTGKRVNIRKGPGTKNPIVCKAQDGVSFKVLSEKDNWLEVKHESGVTGWIFKNLVWGN
jgi:SH3-like domain-containing protein